MGKNDPLLTAVLGPWLTEPSEGAAIEENLRCTQRVAAGAHPSPVSHRGLSGGGAPGLPHVASFPKSFLF